MAKELPYFKFIVSEWNDGDITICSFEAQGLFINLCSLYWSQLGELSLTKCKRRYNACNTTVWDELINEGIIKVDSDKISIDFLDEQLIERQALSEQNRENVLKRWKNKENNTSVLPSNNHRNGSVYNIEEKRREEKKKEERRTPYDVPFENGCLKYWKEWEVYRKELKKKLTPSTALKQIKFLGGRPEFEIIAIINQSITNGWTGLFELKNNGNRTNNQGKVRRADAIIDTPTDYGKF